MNPTYEDDTDDHARDVIVNQLTNCARANTFSGGLSLIALFFALVIFHENGMDSQSRLACAGIGLVIGWIAALWATVFLVRWGTEDDNSVQ